MCPKTPHRPKNETLRRSVLRPTVTFSPDVIPATPNVGSDYGASPELRSRDEKSPEHSSPYKNKLRKMNRKDYAE